MTFFSACARLLFFVTITLSAFVSLHTALNILLQVIPSLASSQPTLDLSWHPPNKTYVNTLETVLHTNGTYGFVFNSSQNPASVHYGTYNWCNMPHVRREEYPVASEQFELAYVEVIHRHHKRTPYAANIFPIESDSWDCSDVELFHYGQPQGPSMNSSVPVFWSAFRSSANPFIGPGFNGTCQFPQITRFGLDDSWQHGKDLYGVYHDLIQFLPSELPSDAISFRVTNNIITSQVAGMLISGMYGATMSAQPLLVEPVSVDSLEPLYSCPVASAIYSSYAVGSTDPGWRAHLEASKSLFDELDIISGLSPDASDWRESWDHYFDNLSSRLCHQKPLPCSSSEPDKCVTKEQIDAVFRLGEYEYSYIYRDASESLPAAVASYGVWIAELSSHLWDVVNGIAGKSTNGVRYRHNVAHDGSIARLLAVLQVDIMVWPGMGAELVFEVFRKITSSEQPDKTKWFLRILWGGKVMRSSNPTLGLCDMIPLAALLSYFNGLIGEGAALIPGKCFL